MAKKPKRAALYLRVSTKGQTVENQRLALTKTAEYKGWDIVGEYSDEGISGAKGRDKRPGLDALLKDATRRKFDIVAAWALDRLGRSVKQVIETVSEIESAGVDVYLEKQAIDTSTSAGRLFFHIMAAVGQFERDIIRDRIAAGIDRVKTKGTKSGKPIGRPRGPSRFKKGKKKGQIKPVKDQDRILKMRAADVSVREIAKRLNISTNTVQRAIKRAKETE